MKYDFPFESHSILPYDPVELYARISQCGSRARECSLSKLHSVRPGFAPLGPCGATPEDHHGQRSGKIQESFYNICMNYLELNASKINLDDLPLLSHFTGNLRIPAFTSAGMR